MSKELVISANRHETRVAIVEDDQVVEVYHQRENEYSLAGSIHKGRVTRVLPGMQSAFVDIGLERDAFLYVSDFFEDNEEYDKIVTSVEEKVLKLDRTPVQPAAAAPVAAAPEAVAGAESPAIAPPAASTTVPPMVGAGPEPRRDERDRDRRGRRGRRRRGGQKGGGRGLPESKFYSPRPEEAPAAAHAEPESAQEGAPETDDFFVLPGESLAKYDERASEAPSAAADFAPDSEPSAEAPVEAPAHEEPVEEFVSELAAEPPAEPLPELSVAAVEVVEESVDVVPVAEAAEEVEAAEDVEPVPTDAAEPEDNGSEGGEGGEAAEIAEVIEIRETIEAQEGCETPEAAEAGEAVVEEEGPEPARIPTSLTATLREQGPRYLHRVSRRMRRRGRDGRGGQADPNNRVQGQEQVREVRPQEQRGEPRSPQGPRERVGENRAPEKGGAPSISDLLREGQEIIVQIAKEPLGQKGARITSHIALPGRFLVYMPTVDHIGVSRKIPSDDERARLKRILQTNRTGIPGGYIVRTAGEGRTEEELRADMMFLYNLWLDMRQKAEKKPAPLLIHHDLNVVERILRDQLTSSFKSIWVDNEEVYEGVLRFVQRFQPALVNRVKLYTRSNPVFDEFNITAELEKALRPKVWLKSGGYIVINQTEALVAIDINTGKFVGKSNRLEDTIVKTNTDAVKEIVRQIRLRDLGGIIVVDFIDMDERKNRQKVMQALEEAMRADRAPYKILQFNDFGLVAITRKRVKQSLERTLCTPCPYCEGAGYVKSPQTIVGEILQEAHKIARAVEGKDVMLRVAPDVARLLKSNQNSYLQELEEILGRTVIVKSDAQLHQEKFDLA
jgi:Rne/Rng family ribonuclease